MSLNKRFNVPENYEVIQTGFKVKGSLAQNEYWDYEILNTKGVKIFTIESWDCTNFKKSNIGFRKYDLQGKLIEDARE